MCSLFRFLLRTVVGVELSGHLFLIKDRRSLLEPLVAPFVGAIFYLIAHSIFAHNLVVLVTTLAKQVSLKNSGAKWHRNLCTKTSILNIDANCNLRMGFEQYQFYHTLPILVGSRFYKYLLLQPCAYR